MQCFVGLFFFFVVLSSGKSEDGGRGAKVKNAAGEGARRRGSSAVRAAAARRADGQPRVFNFKVVKEFPHDPAAFTQGLQYDRICEGSANKQKKCRWGSCKQLSGGRDRRQQSQRRTSATMVCCLCCAPLENFWCTAHLAEIYCGSPPA